MHVLFLTQTYPRRPGDTTGPFIRDLARGLVRGGDRVRVLAPHAPDTRDAWDDDGVEVTTFRYAPERFEVLGYSRSLAADERPRAAAALVTPLYATAALRSLQRALDDAETEGDPVDLVQAHWVVPNALVAAPLAGRVPIVTGLHGSDVFLAEKPGIRVMVARALGRLSGLTGCSPELVDRVCALGFPRAEARVIPYGVDSVQFSPDPGRGRAWRRRLEVPEDAPLLLAVGRMATKKGFHVLAEAFPRLFEALPDLHVVLAGDGDLLEDLRGAAAPWRRRVHFPGAVYRDTLPDLYRAADVFTLPAVHDPAGNVDGLPNVILEAMATALPVVASGISGIPQAVEDGVTGRLVPEGAPGPLAAALVELLGDLPRARALGRRGRERAVEELSWDAIAGRYRAAYVEALERAGKDTP